MHGLVQRSKKAKETYEEQLPISSVKKKWGKLVFIKKAPFSGASRDDLSRTIPHSLVSQRNSLFFQGIPLV